MDDKGFTETKTFYATLKANDEESTQETGIFTGHANTFKLDSVQDIVEPGAFKKTIRETGNKRALFYMHDARNLKSLMGGALNLKEDDDGLYTKGELMLDFDECRKTYKAIKLGIIDRMSIGLRVINATYEKVKDTYIRHITELKLMEVSLCPIGMAANDTALIDSWKSNEDLLKYIVENKHDTMLMNRILSIFSIQPLTEPTHGPGKSTHEPGDNGTGDAFRNSLNRKLRELGGI